MAQTISRGYIPPSYGIDFELTDYQGIGKSASRGFGTVKRVDK